VFLEECHGLIEAHRSKVCEAFHGLSFYPLWSGVDIILSPRAQHDNKHRFILRAASWLHTQRDVRQR
jgi:hypothetical protein